MLTGRPIDRRKAPRIETNGKMPGRMLLEATGGEFPCVSFDVSRIGIGITTDMDLAINTRLVLEIGERRVPLTVVASFKQEDSVRARRYGLFLEDTTVDLEVEFRLAGCMVPEKAAGTGKPGRPGVAAARAPRFAPDQDIQLTAQTFGTRVAYQLSVENLSRSGLLVALSEDPNPPFRVNTLVDMVIDPLKRAFPNSIQATGKIVRRIDDKGKDGEPPTVRLGIAIVDIAPQQAAKWQEALEILEKSTGQGKT
jgi:hypothetical protein